MSGFNFGSNGGSSTPKQPLFGAGNTSGASTGSIFGNASNNANAGSNTPAAKPLFGAPAAGGSNIFGGGASATPASKPSLFGGNQATAGAPQPTSGGFSFGNAAGAGTSGTDGGSTPKPSLFGNASTGAPPAAASGAPKFSFGNNNAASTPATSKTFSLNSTTPAGPPPTTNIFGTASKPSEPASQQASTSLFAPKPATTSTSSTPNLFAPAGSSATPAKPLGSTGGGFGGFSFGNKDASNDANKNTATQQPPAATANSLFGTGAASGTSGAQATPKPSLFNTGSTTPAATPASKPPAFSLGTTPATTQPASQPATNLFAKPQAAGGTQANPGTSAAPGSGLFSKPATGGGAGAGASGFSFGNPADSATSSTPAASGAATTTAGATSGTTASSLFSGAGAAKPAASSGAASSSTPATSLFGQKPAATSGATSTSTTAPNLFGLGGSKPVGTSTETSTSTTATAPTMNTGATTGGTTSGDASKTGDASKSAFGASTAGPAPSTQSRLKNKSMDEIITRWASDLSKYQKEFQAQAEKVAEWDASIVENTDKINKLYSKTFQAERDAAEVERQLRTLEESQQDLENHLDRYEREVELMMKNYGLDPQGRSDGLRGPDQERERTYKLAEKLQDRLNELNKDLTEMIEEINTTSQTLSKTGKPDDPLTKVVRVLNSQLSQLQLIDAGAVQLQEKINKAQRETHRMGANGWNGLGTDPADDFYRSFRGGRTDRFGGVS